LNCGRGRVETRGGTVSPACQPCRRRFNCECSSPLSSTNCESGVIDRYAPLGDKDSWARNTPRSSKHNSKHQGAQTNKLRTPRCAWTPRAQRTLRSRGIRKPSCFSTGRVRWTRGPSVKSPTRLQPTPSGGLSGPGDGRQRQLVGWPHLRARARIRSRRERMGQAC